MEKPFRQEGADLFSSVADCWLAWKQKSLKGSSIARYQSVLSLYLVPTFANKPIIDISRQDVLNFVQDLQTDKTPERHGLSPSSASIVLAVLKNIFYYAEQTLGLPVADLRGISVRKPYKPLRVFSRSEQQRLTRYLLMRRDPTSAGIVLALHTGLRIGELCALRWADISFPERSLNVQHTMQRLPATGSSRMTAVMITPPKSPSSMRTIPLPESIVNMLRGLAERDTCFVLSGTEDYVEPRSLENRFKSALRDCGIATAGFHICRHSFATRCIELGFDVKSLSEILGHASVNITMNRYVHPSMEFKRKNMDRLSELMR